MNATFSTYFSDFGTRCFGVFTELTLVGASLMFVLACAYCYCYNNRGVGVAKSSKSQKNSDGNKSIPFARPLVPFIGNAWSLDFTRCHMELADWARKYGPIFWIRLYSEDVLVLSDYDSIYDALVTKGNDFAGRPVMYRTSQAARNEHSIVWQTFNAKLLFLRKEVLRSIKTFMYVNGKDGFEQKCYPEIETMISRMSHQGAQSFNPLDYIYEAVSNVMLGLVSQ